MKYDQVKLEKQQKKADELTEQNDIFIINWLHMQQEYNSDPLWCGSTYSAFTLQVISSTNGYAK